MLIFFNYSFAQFSTPAHIVVSVILTLFAHTFLCVSNSNLHLIFVLIQTFYTSVNLSILLPYSGFQFLFFLEQVPNKPLDFVNFFELANITHEDLTSPVAAAATAEVKLCPYNKRNRTLGSASLRPSLQQRESNHKNSNMPMLLLAFPSKSFRTFWILLMSVMTLQSNSIKKKYFAWTVWKEQVAVLL